MKDRISLTTKQTWILSTVALSGGLTKYNLEKLLNQTVFPGRPFKVPMTKDSSYNMRKTLDSLVKLGLLKKAKGKKNITLYHIGSHILGLWTEAQPYKPYSRKVMTHLSSNYLNGKPVEKYPSTVLVVEGLPQGSLSKTSTSVQRAVGDA